MKKNAIKFGKKKNKILIMIRNMQAIIGTELIACRGSFQK